MPLSPKTIAKFKAALRHLPQRLAEEKAGLAASIDECMAYFT